MCRRINYGLTLLELLLAISIMVVVIGSLTAVSSGVQQSNEYGDAYGTATQHGRVVLDRIRRMANEAMANEQFPGMLVFSESELATSMPEVLVIWHPTDGATGNPQRVAPANPQRLPLYKELRIWCPDLNAPHQLLEITVPTDTREVPPLTDTSWPDNIRAIRQSPSSQKVVLTDRMHTSMLTNSSSGKQWGTVRFTTRSFPSQQDLKNYNDHKNDGNPNTRVCWENLPWSMGIYNSQTGLRQVWVRVELQVNATSVNVATRSEARPPVPFFTSAAIYFSLDKSKVPANGS